MKPPIIDVTSSTIDPSHRMRRLLEAGCPQKNTQKLERFRFLPKLFSIFPRHYDRHPLQADVMRTGVIFETATVVTPKYCGVMPRRQ